MSRKVEFSFDTDEQKQEFVTYAAARGLSISSFAKYACFVAKDKYKLGSHHPIRRAGRVDAPHAVGQKDGNP